MTEPLTPCIHAEVWDRETANLIGWYASEEVAAERAADLYRANPDVRPGTFWVRVLNEPCEERCELHPGGPR